MVKMPSLEHKHRVPCDSALTTLGDQVSLRSNSPQDENAANNLLNAPLSQRPHGRRGKTSNNKGRSGGAMAHIEEDDIQIEPPPAARPKPKPKPRPKSRDVTIEETAGNGVDTTGNSRIVTMTGTIKRGQHIETVEVRLSLSMEEINKINSSLEKEDKSDCIWGIQKGLHIIIFTLLFIPFAFIASLGVSFYIGTITWYNLFLYLSEERTVVHKVFLSPLLILFYPVLIIFSSLGVGFYGACVQVSWYLSSWLREVRDLEKGFFSWTCQKLGVPQCAPYEVVILDEKPVKTEDLAEVPEEEQVAQTEV